MSEHLVVYVDRLMQPVPSPPVESETPEPSCIMEDNAVDIYEREGEEEEDPLVWWGECRICQEESAIKNLESPCSCNGSLKVFFSHCPKKKRKKMLIRKKLQMFLDSTLTENVFNVGAMKRETLYARSVIRYIRLCFNL